MLQQTQVPRVVPKYKQFTHRFPSFQALADASTAEVLTHWKGLGYNRRAVHLKQTAEAVMQQYQGRLPDDYNELVKLPGIGPYTARAVQAFAFNIPSVFIETNIRTVFLSHFFSGRQAPVDDKEVYLLIEQTLDRDNPREWYYALMDYGAYLKQEGFDYNKHSKHYTKQTPFKGSNREARSRILSYLLLRSPAHVDEIARATGYKHELVSRNLNAMEKEGLLTHQRSGFSPAY
jgi:A/G-specific adenine glycosylase